MSAKPTRCPDCEARIALPLDPYAIDESGHWYIPPDEFGGGIVVCPHICPKCRRNDYRETTGCTYCGFNTPAWNEHMRERLKALLADTRRDSPP